LKAKYKVALAMVGSFALGAVAVQSLHAQARPVAFIVAEIGITDPDGYSKEFLPPVLKTIQEAGGKFLARGGKTVSFDGAPPGPRVVVIAHFVCVPETAMLKLRFGFSAYPIHRLEMRLEAIDLRTATRH
jgi:uncharacterized protein (DUF1330 family)